MENHKPDKKPSALVHFTISIIVYAIIAISYMFFADPPSPWIFAIFSAGVLFTIGTVIHRKRKGHFS